MGNADSISTAAAVTIPGWRQVTWHTVCLGARVTVQTRQLKNGAKYEQAKIVGSSKKSCTVKLVESGKTIKRPFTMVWYVPTSVRP